MENSFEFKSNVLLGEISIAPRLHKFLKVFNIFAAIFLVICVMEEGLKETFSDFYLTIALLCFTYFNTKPKVAFSMADVVLNIANDGVSVLFNNLDRKDKKGLINETYTLKIDDINEIQYSNKHKGICIVSTPIKETYYQSDKKVKTEDFSKGGKPIELLVLLTSENEKEILSNIKTIFGSKVKTIAE